MADDKRKFCGLKYYKNMYFYYKSIGKDMKNG